MPEKIGRSKEQINMSINLESEVKSKMHEIDPIFANLNLFYVL